MSEIEGGGEQFLPLEVLRAVEWSGKSVHVRAPICPVCKWFKVKGHKGRCKLKKALEMLNGS